MIQETEGVSICKYEEITQMINTKNGMVDFIKTAKISDELKP